MNSYLVKFYRLDKKCHDSKVVTCNNSFEAVRAVIQGAKKNLVDINNISVSIKDHRGDQRICDKCQNAFGIYGIKDKIFCKECK